jgi:adenosylcobinamide-phosphate synthase
VAFGDPRRHHPVAAFGRLAGTAERACYAEHRLVGLVYTAGLVGAAAAVGGLVERAGSSRAPVQAAGTALATWIVLGGASLAEQGASPHWSGVRWLGCRGSWPTVRSTPWMR